jgi:hypothetical protein
MRGSGSDGESAAANVAQTWHSYPHIPPHVGMWGLSDAFSTRFFFGGSRAYATLPSIRALDRDGKPQWSQRAQLALTGVGPDGVLEEEGHAQHARAPTPEQLL